MRIIADITKCKGDIVKFGNNTYEIRFIEKIFEICRNKCTLRFAGFLFKNSEIIGNIHDNSELMENSTADEDEICSP